MFRDIDAIVTSLTEASSLIDGLVKSIKDHGGDLGHLNQLLKDAKGDRAILNSLTKKLIGKVWEYADTPFKLGLSQADFNCSASEFLRRYPSVEAHPNMNLDRDWVDPGFPGPTCQYRLWHFDRPVTKKEANFACGVHAGWRELVDFISLLKPDAQNLSCRIIAGGSHLKHSEGTLAVGYPSSGVIGWLGKPEQQKFGVENFWLVRVYRR